MIAWIIITVLLASSLAFLLFYVLSVSPARLEITFPDRAYKMCFRLRLIAMFFELVTVICYGLYYVYPLPIPIPINFPWPWWSSAFLAAVIGLPAIVLMGIGMNAAGSEALRPRKENRMFSGIYNKIRHPQAAGEVFLWLVFSFLLNSPFLAIFSLIYFPLFVLLCWSEEQDLLLRFGEKYADYIRRTGAFWPNRSRN